MHNSEAHQVDGVGAAAGIEYGGPGSTEDGSKPVADLSLRRLVAKGEEDHVRHYVTVQVHKALLAQALLQRVDDALLVKDPDARNARDLSNILILVLVLGQLVMPAQGGGQHETQAMLASTSNASMLPPNPYSPIQQMQHRYKWNYILVGNLSM